MKTLEIRLLALQGMRYKIHDIILFEKPSVFLRPHENDKPAFPPDTFGWLAKPAKSTPHFLTKTGTCKRALSHSTLSLPYL